MEFKNQLLFCEKYSINPNELTLLTILLLAQNNEDSELVNIYFTNRMCSRGSTAELLKGLQDAGVILKSWSIPEKRQKLDIYSIPLNKNMVKDFYKSSFQMGVELFNAYPQFCTINGNLTSLRGVAKKFNSLEDAYRFYGKSIGWNSEKHEEIINLIEWSKEHDILNCSLATFLVNHGWEDLKAIKDGDVANVNYDAVKLA